MKSREFKYWALSRKLSHFNWRLLGRLCWHPDPRAGSSMPIALFKTREHAREAQKTCCYSQTRVERVRVTVETIE